MKKTNALIHITFFVFTMFVSQSVFADDAAALLGSEAKKECTCEKEHPAKITAKGALTIGAGVTAGIAAICLGRRAVSAVEGCLGFECSTGNTLNMLGYITHGATSIGASYTLSCAVEPVTTFVLGETYAKVTTYASILASVGWVAWKMR